MTLSAFGVEDHRITKADADTSPKDHSAVLGGGALVSGLTAVRSEQVRRAARKGVRLHLQEARNAGVLKEPLMNNARHLASMARAAKGGVIAGTAGAAGLGTAAIVSRARSKGKREVQSKAYTQGEIAYHDTQSQIHSRKMTAANRRKDAGLAVAGGGATAGAAAYHYAPQIARAIGRTAEKTEARGKFALAARKATNVRRAALAGGAAVTTAGLGAAAEGALTARHHRNAKTRELAATQDARKRRNAIEKKRGKGIYRSVRGAAQQGERASTEGANAAASAARSAEKIERLIPSKKAAALAAGGLVTAGLGATYGGAYMGQRRPIKVRLAPTREVETFDKAYDPERQRHRRQNVYTGAATGGAVVAGSAAGTLGALAGQAMKGSRKASEKASTARTAADSALHHMPITVRPAAAKPAPGAPAPKRTRAPSDPKTKVKAAYKTAFEHRDEAERLGRRARHLGRGGAAAATAAAGLGALAYGIHRHDSRGGSTYGY